MFPEKKLQNWEWYNSCQIRVSRWCGVNHTSVSTPFFYLFFQSRRDDRVCDWFILPN